MKRTLTWGAVLFVTACAFSCSQSSTSTFAGGAVNEAGVSDGGPSDVDASPQMPTCFRADDICNTLDPSAPLAHQGACTASQIHNFFNECVAGDDAGPDGGGLCDGFVASNEGCASCFYGPTGPSDGGAEGPAPVITYSDVSGAFGVDVAGCVAAISSGSAECKQAYDLRFACGTAACAHCSDSDLQACTTWATTDPASPFVIRYVVDATCQAAIQAVPATDQQTMCGMGVVDLDTQYSIVGTTMCGP